MNIKKIGLSALAGSLAAFSVNAAEVSVSGGAAVYVTNTNEGNVPATFFQGDSVTLSASGETDGGMNISVSWELDSANPGGSAATVSSSYDNRSLSFGNDSIGTFTFMGHGGTSVMGQWDDVMPTAYEEPWDITAGADADRINGVNGNNLWKYKSPTVSGATVYIAHQAAEQGTTAAENDYTRDKYTDFGIEIAPEMVEGLSLGYAQGDTFDGTHDITQSTMWIKYAMGPITVGYQESEADGPTAAKTDTSEGYGITYAVNDSFSIGYGSRESSDGADSNDQEDNAISASYTMGGMTISGGFNSSDNVAGAAADDLDSYEIGLSFAF